MSHLNGAVEVGSTKIIEVVPMFSEGGRAVGITMALEAGATDISNA